MEEKIKSLFLAHTLFAQFLNCPEKLKITIPEEGTLVLRIDNFPGLDTSLLTPRALRTLEVTDISLSQGHITMAGPDGITIQYPYNMPYDNHKKLKF